MYTSLPLYLIKYQSPLSPTTSILEPAGTEPAKLYEVPGPSLRFTWPCVYLVKEVENRVTDCPDDVGGISVAVGGTGVAVGGKSVVGGTAVAVGGILVAFGGISVAMFCGVD